METTNQTNREQILKEQERMLFGAWLKGYHLEDTALFKDTDFSDAELFRQINKGDIWEIKKRLNRPISELLKLCNDGYFESFYKTAIDGFYLEKVKSRIINDCQSISSLDDVASTIEMHIRDSCRKTANTNFFESLETELTERKTGKIAKFGLSILDDVLDGIYRTELTVISAKTSVGKSAFSLQVAENVSKEHKVLFFPLEMTTNAMIGRLLIRHNLVTSKELKSGNIEGKENQVKEYLNNLQKGERLIFYEGVNRLEDIKAIVRKEKPYLVVIDQLSQIAVSPHFNSINEKYSYVSNEIKSMCMQEKVATFLLCQVSPKNTQTDPLASIKDSSQISADADNIIILSRLELNQDRSALKNGTTLPIRLFDGESLIRLEFPKHRDGKIGCYHLAFNREKQTFIERMSARVIEV